MVIPGRVQNGVVVLEGGSVLPEGAAVIVSYAERGGPIPRAERKRVEVPLIRTGRPGSVHLTNDRIAELLEEDDLVSGR
jgi:hypothetical protein